MKADINSIHDWILKNKQKLDSQGSFISPHSSLTF